MAGHEYSHFPFGVSASGDRDQWDEQHIDETAGSPGCHVQRAKPNRWLLRHDIGVMDRIARETNPNTGTCSHSNNSRSQTPGLPGRGANTVESKMTIATAAYARRFEFAIIYDSGLRKRYNSHVTAMRQKIL